MGLIRSLSWGTIFVAAGTLVASGIIPGASDWSPGPRIGIATLLIVLGLVVYGFALAPWIARRTSRPENQGACPVGAKCPCGQFNFKPRTSCRQCGKATSFSPV